MKITGIFKILCLALVCSVVITFDTYCMQADVKQPLKKEKKGETFCILTDEKNPLSSDRVTRIALSHDGQYIAGGQEGGIFLANAHSGDLIDHLELPENFEDPIIAIHFSRDDHFIVAHAKHQVGVWRLDWLAKKYELFDYLAADESDEIIDLVMSNDAQVIALACLSGAFVIMQRGVLEGGTKFFPDADADNWEEDGAKGQFCQAYTHFAASMPIQSLQFISNRLLQINLADGSHSWDITGQTLAGAGDVSLRNACLKPYQDVLASTIPVQAQVLACGDFFGNNKEDEKLGIGHRAVPAHVRGVRDASIKYCDLSIYKFLSDNTIERTELLERIDSPEYYFCEMSPNIIFAGKTSGITIIKAWDASGLFLGMCTLDEAEELMSNPVVLNAIRLRYVVRTKEKTLKVVTHSFFDIVGWLRQRETSGRSFARPTPLPTNSLDEFDFTLVTKKLSFDDADSLERD